MANKILYWLGQKGLTAVSPVVDFAVQNIAGVEQIVRWDAAKLGAQPANADLAAIDPAVAAAWVIQQIRTADLSVLVTRALARAVHVRFGRQDAATMSAATWRNILEAAWDAERSA